MKKIGRKAFTECVLLESVDLPYGLEDIGDEVFSGDTNLMNVTIPNSVTHVGHLAFGLTGIYINAVNNGEQLIYVDKWVVGFRFKEQVKAITPSMFKSDTVGIADYVFNGYDHIQTVAIPKSLKYIGNGAFIGCVNLWKFTSLEDSLISIGNSAFENCSLTNISLGNGLKSIGNYAFLGNKQLDKVFTNNGSDLVVSRLDDYINNRFYEKLETKIHMEIMLRDNNLINKAKEGYIRYQDICSKTLV